MSNLTKDSKIWSVIQSSAGVVGLVLWFALLTMWDGYAHTRPTVPDSRAGRIYALSEHGVTVYLTNPERFRLFLLAGISIFSVLIVVLIGVSLKKDWRRPKPWETRS